jgi:hypothetical protein
MFPIDRDGPWISELVDESLKCLRKAEWKAQKAGVTILSALAQTSMHYSYPENLFPDILGYRARGGDHRPQDIRDR